MLLPSDPSSRPFALLRGYFGFPLALTSIVVPALFLGITWWMATTQNAFVEAQHQKQVATLEAKLATNLEQTALDYARWDEAHLRLSETVDEEWFQLNVGVATFGTVTFDAALVLTAEGLPLVGSWRDESSAWQPDNRLGAGFQEWLLRTLAKDPAAGARTFARSDLGIVVTAVAPITRHTADTPGPWRYLLLLQLVDDNIVADYGTLLGMERLGLGDAAEGRSTRLLVDHAGRSIARWHWQPSRPGDAALATVAPFACALLVVLLGANLALSRRGHTATRQLQLSEAQARHLANHDPLTNLPNRRALRAALDHLIARRAPAQLMFIDLDGFKQINDELGHEIGDSLLCEIAGRLVDVVPEKGLLCRMGGDEFAVLVETSDAAAEQLADEIVSTVAQPVATPQLSIAITASVGICPGHDITDHGEFMRRADVAMYAAKEAGRSRARRYDEAIDAARTNRRQIDDDMRKGFTRGEFWVAFQPIVDARGGSIAGAEALLRWNHPTRGAISPAIFVPIAEESGFIRTLTQFVLTATRRAMDGCPSLRFSVNLSPIQLLDEELPARLEATLAGLPPGSRRFELEITEGILIQQPERAARMIERLRALGVGISLDDFGTGYASIGYLQRFPLDKIKLDRSFVRDIAGDNRALRTCRAIVALAAAMDKPVTAEGVETRDQARLLTEAGCSLLQGFLFAGAMRLEDLRRLSRARSLLPAIADAA